MKKFFPLLCAMVVVGALAWIVASSLHDDGSKESVPVPMPARSDVSSPSKTTPAAATGTFTAPIGAGDHAGTEGPWARRILGATSPDGLVWTRTNRVISDQADVPSLAMDASGTLFMYYYGWTVGTKQNAPAVATSTDNGATWTFYYLGFTGFPNRGDVSDPDVLFENGTFHLYGTTRAAGHASVVYGESTDGINFTYKSVAYKPEGADAGVASVYQVGDAWRLISLASLGVTGSGTEAGQHWVTESSDGKTFSLQEKVLYKIGGVPYFNGNVIPVDGGYRMYLFSDVAQEIRSWTSTDGDTWTLEPGVRLALDITTGEESGYVGDPDIIQLPDGTFFMAYATLIP